KEINMTYQLIITEKPSAARKISAALAEGTINNEKKRGITYHEFRHSGKDIVVVPAVGHLYGLRQITKDWTYPVFNVEWAPTSEIDKGASYSKKYLENIKTLAKKADDFVVATDLDIEGETIAYNIVRFACKQKDAKRMKFSTLTKNDLVKSYSSMSPTIIRGLADAGITRHTLDFYWGINISRALTTAVKSAGQYKVLSAGRVQGPALHFLATREKEISAFNPTPFWQLDLIPKEHDFRAHYEEEKIWDQEKALKIKKECDGKDARVKDITRKEYKQNPPTPFNLTDLQVEAHKLFKMIPKETQAIAQELYLGAYISYPRTSSQKLPKEIGYRTIIEKLKQNSDYEKSATFLLAKKDLKPNEGKKTDDAHPSIYPTGEKPPGLAPKQKKIYDLIVKRFMSVFADAAIRESNTIILNIDAHKFITEGKRTITPNWFDLYDPYVKLEEITLPELNIGDIIAVEKIDFLSKETQPPSRYNEASIIRELERRNLGTKATRATIIENLYNRGYLQEKRIEVTDLGLQVIDTLEKFSDDLISENLTREFESDMEQIEKGKLESASVLKKAEKDLKELFSKFREHEKEIGSSLIGAIRSTQEQSNMIGKCPKCEKGNLIIKRGKYGRFIACDQYPECKTIISIPQKGMIKSANKLCPECNHPMIRIAIARKKLQELCINKNCKSKQVDDNPAGKKKELGKCPKCGAPLVERSSIYGKFLGCSNYPKCKTIVTPDKKDTEKK
ncbi:MAG: DNA topoisomerase I, partial [archaeon]|nr:DNA topoisomerase I [archaeon]